MKVIFQYEMKLSVIRKNAAMQHNNDHTVQIFPLLMKRGVNPSSLTHGIQSRGARSRGARFPHTWGWLRKLLAHFSPNSIPLFFGTPASAP